MTDERLAIHEAGHTVAAVALGLKVWTASVSPNTAVILSRHSPMEPEAMIRFQLAGAAAESLAFGTVNEKGAVSDRVKAKREAFAITGDLAATSAMVEACRPEVRDLLGGRWLAVERVALALLEGTGTLTGTAVQNLVGRGGFLSH